MDEDDRDLRLDNDYNDEPSFDEIDEESEEDLNIDLESASYDDVVDDSVKLYLREIGKIPLLSNEEEAELAARVVKGDKKAKKKTRSHF